MRFYTTNNTTKLLIPLTCVYCLWLMSCHCWLMANGEFYSSVDSLKALGSMEATLLQSYRQYLEAQRQEMHNIRRFIAQIKYHQALAEEDVEDYLGNPINAFVLIKRMVNDWSHVIKLLKLDDVRNELFESLTQLEELPTMPDENELKGAIRGLGRLQTIYKLNAGDMANGVKYGSSLTWRDCFEIGTTFFDEQNFELAKTWLELSLHKLKESRESNEIKSTFHIHIKEYLAWNLQSVGATEMAVEHLDDIVTEDSEHHVKLAKILMNAPLQVEPVHDNPSITLYHNLLNENQISKLILETDGNMERSHVVDGSNRDIAEETRVSQQIWLAQQKSAITKMIYNLISAITGLNMKDSEAMQVANYGIGGQYEPHYDFLGNDNKIEGKYRDRLSTNMIYLSNVEEGGYTVFPKLQVFLKPTKGAMVMWYNLHKSVDSDMRTLHAGCPVLKGSKIIANIWTDSENQELRRPCGLESDTVQINI